MKTRYFVFCCLLFTLFSSFEISEECEYAGSNMGYVKTQTQKAIVATNVNKSHFLAYKALNALEKSKKQVEECGCIDAFDFMKDALENLKMATRATSLDATRILLNRSLENTLASLQAIEGHDEHGGPYGTDVLALNTIDAKEVSKPIDIIDDDDLKQKIDISLISYEASLQTVIETVDCKKALAFATRIYDHCEAQLLKENLPEGKKYYNLRTKEITKKALETLGDCPKKQ